jgi:hypothetical protein
MELRFLFDGVIYNNPITWKDVNTGLQFDSANQIITINHDVEHKWAEDAYNFIYDKWTTGDFCDLITVQIQGVVNGSFVDLYTGEISVLESSFDESERIVSLKIKDSSFGARIENNKGVRVALDSIESKNGVSISQATESYVFAFTPSDGVYQTSSCRGFAVYDAFAYLINWMTDGQVQFESDFFDPALSNGGKLDWLVSGIDLRNEGEVVSAPKFSFQELYDQMRKMRNIMMGFELSPSGIPVVRIEDIDYFRSSTDTIFLPDVKRVTLSFDNDIVYTSVKVGSDIVKPTDCDGGDTLCNASNNVSYFGFETEYYSLTGECVSATELDLSTSDPFIIDTNKIQEVVEFDEDTYDEKVFLINRNSTTQQNADKSDPIGLLENWYNEEYTNKNVLARYQDYLTGTLSLFNLYNGVNLFLYEGNTPSSSLSPLGTPTFTRYPTTAGTGIPLNDLIYDPYNRIDTGTERFTPIDEGAYQFCVGCSIDEFGTPPPAITVAWYLQIDHYDEFGTLLQTYQSDIREYLTSAAANFEEWTSPFITMDSGDYCVFSASYAQVGDPGVVGQATIFIGGSLPSKQYFQCCASRVAIQDAQVNTGDKRFIAISSFEYPVDFETMQSFLNDTTQRVRITSGGIDRTGYIKTLEYNFVTGNAAIEILSDG